MREFINMLVERGYQKRTIGFIENGSWAPMAMKVMKSKLEGLKNISFTENNVTILSALNEQSTAQLMALAEELAASYSEADCGCEQEPILPCFLWPEVL